MAKMPRPVQKYTPPPTMYSKNWMTKWWCQKPCFLVMSASDAYQIRSLWGCFPNYSDAYGGKLRGPPSWQYSVNLQHDFGADQPNNRCRPPNQSPQSPRVTHNHNLLQAAVFH